MKALQYSKLKLAFGILIPVLVMVVTLTMLGVSFAWFSNSPDVYVESINLSIAEPYQIVFNAGENSANHNYRGQTAIYTDGRLITSNGDWTDGIKQDRAFCFAKLISLDTKGSTVDFELYIDNARIYSSVNNSDGTTQDIDKNNYNDRQQEIQYVFTWFFKAHTGDKTTLPTNKANDKDMIEYAPAANEEWYTPYGLLKFGENGKVAQVNGNNYTAGESIERANILNFTTDGEALFDIFIVFAPEQLFWQQFFDGLDGKTAQTTYTDDEMSKMFGSYVQKKQMYYSGYEYLGSKFAFSATINVTNLHGDEEQQP